MALHRIQVTDRHEQPIGGIEVQFLAKGRAFPKDMPHTVRDHGDPPAPHQKIAAHLLGQPFRHRDGAGADSHGGAERHATLQAAGVVPAAVHRDDVRDAGKPRGPCAVDGHRELVAVRHVHLMAAKCRRQGSGARRRYWSVQLKMLHRYAASGQPTLEPPFSRRWDEDDAPRARSMQADRKVHHDLFRAAGTVRFD